jgi:hypothetical protein
MATPGEVPYCTREQVQATIDQSESVRLNRRIDDACRAAARDLEGELHRRFYPTAATRYVPARMVSGGIVWLNRIDLEVCSASTLVVDGVTLVDGTDYYLTPDVAPFTAIRRPVGAAGGWPVAERAMALTSRDFGGSNSSEACGALAAAITTTSATTMTVTDSAAVGVGDLVTVDLERVIVREKELVTTGTTLTGNVAADTAVTTIPVGSGTAVKTGEMILVGAERMFVEQIAGNNLIVERAVQGSVLAAHVSTDVVYAPRLCTIVRAAAGTTAATHLNAAALARNVPPSMVGETALAIAINYVEQGKAGWSRTVGAGDAAREASGAGIAAQIARAYTAYGRQGRIGVC